MALPLWNSKTTQMTLSCLHPNGGAPWGFVGVDSLKPSTESLENGFFCLKRPLFQKTPFPNPKRGGLHSPHRGTRNVACIVVCIAADAPQRERKLQQECIASQRRFQLSGA